MDSLNLNAEELRDFRRVLDWSQQRMADELGVARNTINRMEKGHMAIEIRTALAVRYLAWHHSMIEKAPTKQPGQANVQAAPELGDSHKQVVLPLPTLDSKHSDCTSDPAMNAWEIYHDVLRDRQGSHLIEESYFKLVKTSKVEYTYLFLLQLLERLVALPVPWHTCCPEEWFDMKALRAFTNRLYKANPQWH
ncbi:helix-turn-helix transcriptional regulator [Aeromonas salmonicida]|uniref:helix-turn-helix transcriptional regulator n=1 Tax=Aeromonas salmonicida TaxID=645 RepID=UPI00072FB754|nr:helix-turn-helix transcriptional regulator [Aeromonas salmonicida]KTA77082.1 hypothetical protein VO68_07365 [Aeromonas salmonicida]